MLPTIFIVNELPKSVSGKIDRKLLRDLEINKPHYGSGDDGPETTMEEMIFNIWKEFLPDGNMNVLDNFFDAGGHSLMMAQIHHRLKSRLNTNINLIDLFQYPSIRSLAKHLESVVSENVLLKQSADVQ